jgi:hypothetical protein
LECLGNEKLILQLKQVTVHEVVQDKLPPMVVQVVMGQHLHPIRLNMVALAAEALGLPVVAAEPVAEERVEI